MVSGFRPSFAKASSVGAKTVYWPLLESVCRTAGSAATRPAISVSKAPAYVPLVLTAMATSTMDGVFAGRFLAEASPGTTAMKRSVAARRKATRSQVERRDVSVISVPLGPVWQRLIAAWCGRRTRPVTAPNGSGLPRRRVLARRPDDLGAGWSPRNGGRSSSFRPATGAGRGNSRRGKWCPQRNSNPCRRLERPVS